MNWLRENLKIVVLVFGEMLAFAWTSLSLILDLTGVMPGTRTESLALSGFIIFAILVSAHIYSLQRKLLPRMDLVFGDFPACRHIFLSDGIRCTLFRVGLINKGAKTIENVRVSLVYLEPQGISFGPIRLRFMNQRQPDEELRLHPGKAPSLFFDVIQDFPYNTESKRQTMFNLPYAVSGIPNLLQPGNYRLTLLAEGQDVQPIRKSFQVLWDGEKMRFEELASNH